MFTKRQSPRSPLLVTCQRTSLGATKDLELKMRWLVHVLVRLTIAAACTNSAAAIDTQPSMASTSSPRAISWSNSCHVRLNR